MSGWIKVSRDILEHWLWNDKPFSKGQAWIDILLQANHSDKKILIGGEVTELKRGEFIISERKLVDRWGWSKSKVRSFLEILENDSMIVKKTDQKKTTINVVNYEHFQFSETKKEPQKDHEKTTERPLKDQEQECKKDKNINNNIYTCAFETLWSAYPRRKEKAKAYKCYKARLSDGYSEDELLLAVKRYADECEKKKTEEQYIKHAATFLGPNTPFLDYIRDYKPPAQRNKNKFNNFEQRKYDMSSLELQLQIAQMRGETNA